MGSGNGSEYQHAGVGVTGAEHVLAQRIVHIAGSVHFGFARAIHRFESDGLSLKISLVHLD
jgi:hypothetical protein